MSLNGIISVYLVNLSIITSIKSYFYLKTILLDSSSFVIKSIVISY